MLRIERDGAAVVWTLDRPHTKNALSAELLARLRDAVRAASEDPSIRAAVLTGAGGAFASGGDSRELRDKSSAADAAALSDAGEGVCRALGELPFPVVAAIPGVALGGGAELALACDLRVADGRARLCFKHARMGATTSWGSLPRLHALVGPSAAARLLFTAAELSAGEALRLGLVDHVAEDDASLTAALAWCADIAAAAPGAVAEHKALLRAATASFYATARALEREAFVRTWSGDEHAEAMTAYFERRAPRWSR